LEALALEDEDGVVGRGEGALLPGAGVVDGVEFAMYKFEAPVIALVRRVVVPEMAWLGMRMRMSATRELRRQY
jgi:hypothetical protein